jgi:type IV secretion system protein VirB9
MIFCSRPRAVSAPALVRTAAGLLALLCVVATAATAETTPQSGALDARVRIATWTEGQVYRIVTTLTHVTSVEFGEGETIRSIIAGDTAGFQFDGVPGGRAFAIKPVATGVATNITVYTNRRSYYFHVVEARETPHYVVQFRYPDEQAPAARAVAAEAPNTGYAVSGQSEITPIAVWDDGTFTYFRFARNAPVPAIFRHAAGAERTVNSLAESDGVIRVSGVSREWVLRLGDLVICVQDISGAGA